MPTVVPTAKCKLRLLKLERVRDYLLMEEEYVRTQELLKPHEERNEEERTKVSALGVTGSLFGCCLSFRTNSLPCLLRTAMLSCTHAASPDP